jgi:hypothetical protein
MQLGGSERIKATTKFDQSPYTIEVQRQLLEVPDNTLVFEESVYEQNARNQTYIMAYKTSDTTN